MNQRSLDISSKEYLSLLQKGDERAFEALFRLYYGRLLHISKGFLGNANDAEEIVQNVFLRIWERRTKLEKFNTGFIYAITRNLCLDYLKHKKVRIEYAKNCYHKQLSNPIPFVESEAASKLIEEELRKKIKESIDLLPDKCKDVFIKSRFEGLKNQEIADSLGLSKRTVDTHIYLALKHMKFQLKEFMTYLL